VTAAARRRTGPGPAIRGFRGAPLTSHRPTGAGRVRGATRASPGRCSFPPASQDDAYAGRASWDSNHSMLRAPVGGGPPGPTGPRIPAAANPRVGPGGPVFRWGAPATAIGRAPHGERRRTARHAGAAPATGTSMWPAPARCPPITAMSEGARVRPGSHQALTGRPWAGAGSPAPLTGMTCVRTRRPVASGARLPPGARPGATPPAGCEALAGRPRRTGSVPGGLSPRLAVVPPAPAPAASPRVLAPPNADPVFPRGRTPARPVARDTLPVATSPGVPAPRHRFRPPSPGRRPPHHAAAERAVRPDGAGLPTANRARPYGRRDRRHRRVVRGHAGPAHR